MLLVVSLFIQLHKSFGNSPCPTGTVLSSAGDACFSPISADTFYGAELSCLQLGGHLPSIPQKSVNEDLVKMGTSYFPGCDSIWIGMDARGKWVNGDSSTWNNWDGEDDSYPTNCASISLVGEGKWAWKNCSEPRGYLCSFLPLFVVTNTDKPMPQCLISQPTGPPEETKDVWCTVLNHRCSDWNIAVLIGLKSTSNVSAINLKIKAIQSYLLSIVGECSTASNLLIITPGTIKNGFSCTTQHTTKDGIHTLTDNISPAQVQFRKTDDEDIEIITMFEALENCTTFPLAKNYAGMVIFFSDVDCDDVCTDMMVDNQKNLIDSMTSNNYNLRFIRIMNDPIEKECFSTVFSRCTEYNPLICSLSSYNTVEDAENDKNQQFCMTTDTSKGIPTVWIIVSSVVAFLIIVGCVGIRCFFRYKALKQGNKWSWFVWKSPENETVPAVTGGKVTSAPNEYGELHREPDPWEISPENLFFTENDVLGSGAFATVYLGYVKGDIPLAKMNNGQLKLGIRKEADGTYKVAVKRLPPHATAEGRMDFSHEIEFMKDLGYHPHVLSLLGVVNSTHDAMIVIENCEHGDLLTFVRSRKETFALTEPDGIEFGSVLRVKELISIAWQISDGMSYLASRNFIHRDIAARNILLTRSMVAKIGDFGLCRLVDSSLYTAKGGRLPIKWMAPESLKYYEYSLKSDVWSFGILLFELFSLGEAPYGTVQPSEMPKFLDQGNRLPQPKTCPNEIYKIMMRCWEKASGDRPDIDTIREELTALLNNDSSSYGYLAVQDLDDMEVCEV